MNVTLQMVEDLNRRSASLNSKRQQQLGMYEASRQAYEKAVMAYKAKYGVVVDDTNIQQEYNNVKAQLEADYNRVNAQIVSIETGEYKKAVQPVAQAVQKPAQANVDAIQGQVNQMQNGGVAPQQVAPQPVAQPQAPIERATISITAEMLNAKPTPVAVPKELQGDDDEDAPVDNSGLAQFGIPTIQPSATQPKSDLAQFGVQNNPAPKQNDVDDIDDEVVTVSGWGTSNGGGIDINAHFPNILGK